VLDKSSPIEAIFDTVRAAAAGKTLIGPIPPDVMRAGASLIDPQDQSIFGLAVAGEPPNEIAAVLTPTLWSDGSSPWSSGSGPRPCIDAPSERARRAPRGHAWLAALLLSAEGSATPPFTYRQLSARFATRTPTGRRLLGPLRGPGRSRADYQAAAQGVNPRHLGASAFGLD
jgi:hypothetical protein